MIPALPSAMIAGMGEGQSKPGRRQFTMLELFAGNLTVCAILAVFRILDDPNRLNFACALLVAGLIGASLFWPNLWWPFRRR